MAITAQDVVDGVESAKIGQEYELAKGVIAAMVMPTPATAARWDAQATKTEERVDAEGKPILNAEGNPLLKIVDDRDLSQVAIDKAKAVVTLSVDDFDWQDASIPVLNRINSDFFTLSLKS